MIQFDHDKLDVYHLAINFFATSDDIIKGLPKGRAKLADQLSRASLSICATRSGRSEAKSGEGDGA